MKTNTNQDNVSFLDAANKLLIEYQHHPVVGVICRKLLKAAQDPNQPLIAEGHNFSDSKTLERSLKGFSSLARVNISYVGRAIDLNVHSNLGRKLSQPGIALLVAHPTDLTISKVDFIPLKDCFPNLRLSNLELGDLLKQIDPDALHQKDEPGKLIQIAITTLNKPSASDLVLLAEYNQSNNVKIKMLVEENGIFQLVDAPKDQSFSKFVEDQLETTRKLLIETSRLLKKEGLLEKPKDQRFEEYTSQLLLILSTTFSKISAKIFSKEVLQGENSILIKNRVNEISSRLKEGEIEKGILKYTDFLVKLASEHLYKELKLRSALNVSTLANATVDKSESVLASNDYTFKRYARPLRIDESSESLIRREFVVSNHNIIGALFKTEADNLSFRSFGRKLQSSEERSPDFFQNILKSTFESEIAKSVIIVSKGKLAFDEIKNICLLAKNSEMPVHLLHLQDAFTPLSISFNLYSLRKEGLDALLFNASLENIANKNTGNQGLGLESFERLGILSKDVTSDYPCHRFDLNTKSGNLFEMTEKLAGESFSLNTELALSTVIELKDYWDYPEFLEPIVRTVLKRGSSLQDVLSDNLAFLDNNKRQVLESLCKIKSNLGEAALAQSGALLVKVISKHDHLPELDNFKSVNSSKDFVETFREIYKIAESLPKHVVDSLVSGLGTQLNKIPSLYSRIAELTGHNYDQILLKEQLKNRYIDLLAKELLLIANQLIEKLAEVTDNKKLMRKLDRTVKASLGSLKVSLIEPSKRLVACDAFDLIETELRELYLRENNFKFSYTTFDSTPSSCVKKISFDELCELKAISTKYSCDFSELITNYGEIKHRDSNFCIDSLQSALNEIGKNGPFELIGIVCDPEILEKYCYIGRDQVLAFRA
jgi:hypothetical protein